MNFKLNLLEHSENKVTTVVFKYYSKANISTIYQYNISNLEAITAGHMLMAWPNNIASHAPCIDAIPRRMAPASFQIRSNTKSRATCCC